MKQRAIAEAQQQRMGMAGQIVGRFGVEAGALGSLSALQQSQAAAEAARQKQYLGMGMGAAGAALGQAGGWMQQGAEGGEQQPYIDRDYPSDIRLKQQVQQPRGGEEDRLIRALQAAGASTESALDAAMLGRRDEQALQLGRELQAAGQETDALLDALATPRAPAGLGALSPADQQYMAQQAGMQLPSRVQTPAAQPLPGAMAGLGAISPAEQSYMAGLPSDRILKEGVQSATPAERRQLLTELSALPDVPQAQQEQAEMRRQRALMLRELAGAGKRYQYTQQAQQQLGQPAGMQYGPMAQDLEKSPLGASAVVDTAAGKMVDPGRLTMIQAGLIGQLGERVEALEGKRGR
jgi:hypothetical protein